MPRAAQALTPAPNKSPLDRTLSLFTDVRAGEGATAVLMLANIFVLLVATPSSRRSAHQRLLREGGLTTRPYAVRHPPVDWQ